MPACNRSCRRPAMTLALGVAGFTLVLVAARRAAADDSPRAVRFTAEQKAFWAFQPVLAVHPPTVKTTAWVTSPLDRFILADDDFAQFVPDMFDC